MGKTKWTCIQLIVIMAINWHWLDSAWGGVVQLSSNPIDGGIFYLTPDGSRVVYTSTVNGVRQLFSTLTDGRGPEAKLSTSPTGRPVHWTFYLTPDGSRVVYQGDLNVINRNELYSASTTASDTQVVLSSSIPEGDIEFHDFAVTADSQRVVYQGDLTTDGQRGLYSSSTSAPGTQVQLSATVSSSPFKLTPGGARVVYLDGGLFSVPTDGSSLPIQLSSNIGPETHVANFLITPDGSHVVYRADLDSVTPSTYFNLFAASTTVENSEVSLSSSELPAGVSSVGSGFQITPDGNRVVYTGDLDTNAVNELYINTVAGGNQIKLSSYSHPASGVGAFSLNPDGERVIYTGDLSIDGIYEVFSARTDGSGPQLQLSSSSLSKSVVYGAYNSPDGSRVLYNGSLDTPGMLDLYSSATDATGTQVRLSPTSYSLFGGLTFTPDGSRVIYHVRNDGKLYVYSAPTDGSEPPIELLQRDRINGGTPEIRALQISDDGRFATFIVGVRGFLFINKELYYADIMGGEALLVTSTPGYLIDHKLVGNQIAFWADIYESNQEVHLFGFDMLSSPPGDFDGDGDIDGQDFLVWQRDPSVGSLHVWQANFGKSISIGPPTAVSAVPEPMSVVLAAVIAAFCSLRSAGAPRRG